jgi:tetratricopeptide (TPR) repeat protein
MLLLACSLLAACSPSPPAGPASAPLSPDSLGTSPEDQLRSLGVQIGMNPQDYTLYYQRSQAYDRLDSAGPALADAEKALQLFPNNPELHYWRGFLAYNAGDTLRAFSEYRAAAGLGSQEPEVYYQMGQLYFFRGRDDSARHFYRKAREQNDAEPLYYFAEGYLEERRGRIRQALASYRDALRVDSLHSKTLLQLHDLYLGHFQNEETALSYLNQLLRHEPLQPLARYYQGNAFFRKALRSQQPGQEAAYREAVNQAVESYTLAINKDPQFAQAWYSRGYCYFLSPERLQEAVLDFQKTLSLDPDHAQAHFMMGSIYERSGDLGSAAFHYRRAAELKPPSRDFRKALQEVEAALKQR